ncbi:MAG: T9SS type A sorting domain-containing protein [Chitinophagales bacterium]
MAKNTRFYTESEATSIRIYNNDERKNYYIIASTATSTVSGNKTVSGYGAKDIWIVKLNETGEIVSQGMLGGEQDEYSPTLSKGDLSAIGEQDIILACVSNSNASGLKTENNYGGGAVNNETDFWTVNFNFEKTNPTAPLTGKVYNDFANDCNYVFGLDQPISGFLVRDNTSGNYCVTNQNGEYQLPVDSGSHEIELLIPHQFENIYTTYNCPTNGKLSININNIDNIPVNNNFFIDNKRCVILNIDISSDRRRRCLKSLTVVNYSNIGNENANNVKVYVQMPEFVRILAANKPYTQINENTYEFLIDNIAYGQSGIIRIVDETLCESGIAGLTQCTKAWITPKNECFNNLDTAVTSWDKSSIAVSGSCTSYRVQFVIKNNGEDMQDSSEYRIYQNSQLGRTANFKLLAGDSIIINLQNNGATYRIEADQSYGHPGNSHPTYTVEACALPANRGYYNDLPQDDEDYEVAEECLPIIDSYDPNDKQVQPKGSGENGQLYRNSTLHYTIRFQNTGTDTAYKVVVIDTLDANLDITTLMFGASSHTYDFEFVGNTNYIVLKFTFNDINLPDSTTNELASNGFLSFSIKPHDTISNGITIQNNADIYFDFNDPIKTNTTSNLMDDRFPTTNNLLIITAINNDKNSELVQVYPNPFSNEVTFSFKQNSQAYQIQIISIDGKAIKEEIINSNIVSFGINNIANGMYYYKILDKKGNIINNGKLVKQ